MGYIPTSGFGTCANKLGEMQRVVTELLGLGKPNDVVVVGVIVVILDELQGPPTAGLTSRGGTVVGVRGVVNVALLDHPQAICIELNRISASYSTEDEGGLAQNLGGIADVLDVGGLVVLDVVAVVRHRARGGREIEKGGEEVGLGETHLIHPAGLQVARTLGHGSAFLVLGRLAGDHFECFFAL